jgi:ankyrin repeat protein
VEEGHAAVVKLLLETSQVDIDSKDKDGQTPLLWAARKGHEEIVKLLLATGRAKVESKSTNGEIPLFWVASRGYEVIVKLLLEMGDQVDVDLRTNYG